MVSKLFKDLFELALLYFSALFLLIDPKTFETLSHPSRLRVLDVVALKQIVISVHDH